MSQQSPFSPVSNTFTLNATAVASTAFQAPTGSGSQCRIVNTGPNPAFITWAIAPPIGSGSTATAAVLPTAGNPPGTSQYGVRIMANTVETVTIPQNAFISAICAAAQTAVIDFTFGEGS